MHLPLRLQQLLIPVMAALVSIPFAVLAIPKPMAQWQWLDILGEGGTALMAGAWAVMILGSRPGGRVTTLLAGGLAAIMLGAWADCLDEFFRVAGWLRWNNMLESILTPLGMGCVTYGLWCWREEQSVLSAHLVKRERLFRDHRALDALTQVADLAYLRRQIRLERERRPDAPCALVMLDLDGLPPAAAHPADEARLLQAVSHQLLLNLRGDDLLCRAAGDRFVVLMPETPLWIAQTQAQHLAAMVEAMTYHPRPGATRLRVRVRLACALATADDGDVLDALKRTLQPTPAAAGYPAAHASAAA